ncbi:hypothetical protein [Lewinella sp. LCG006]|uniref:hypothetical protein n=1 Tax=Lewinella sp. LCG006 TaxID=3231911 RepID=UPI0034615D87
MEKDQHMLDGFNDGYTIQKYEPELAQQMLTSLANTDAPYSKGFHAGAKEYQMEAELDKTNQFPGIDNHPGYEPLHREPEKDQDMDMDK